MANKAFEDKNLNESSVEEMNKSEQEQAAEGKPQNEVDNTADNMQQEDNKTKAQESAVPKLEEELNNLKDKYLRLYSDFENYKRRSAKERLEIISSANKDLMIELLPVLDDFERAINVSNENSETAPVHEGIQLVYTKFLKVLEQKGLKEMETEPGDAFDSEYHEAVAQIPAPDENLKGKIVDVLEKGFYLGDKVIRFAKVVTGI
jgi:molecular chaperone GrpE